MMAPPQGRKKSQGRKKIEMKPIADENARTVTFSKRRVGLFKKATELSILCGTQIALIIFSLGGRAYSFGHPSVESVLSRFRSRNPNPNLQDSVHAMRIRSATLQQLKEQCDQKNKEIEAKKVRGKEIEVVLEGSSCQISEERLNQLDIDQLKKLKGKMEKLREKVRRLANGPRLGSVKSSLSTLNDVGPSTRKKDPHTNMDAKGPRVNFTKPSHFKCDVLGPSDLNKVNQSNIEADKPQVDFVKHSHLKFDVVGPPDPKKVDLAKAGPNEPLMHDIVKPSYIRLDVGGPSITEKVSLASVEANGPWVDFAKPSYLRLDVNGPSTNIGINGSKCGFLKPSHLRLDGGGPSVPKKVDAANINANGQGVRFIKPSHLRLDIGGPSVSKKVDMENIGADGSRVDFVTPLNLRLGVITPSASKEVDLTNLEGDKHDASPIPPNWLKL